MSNDNDPKPGTAVVVLELFRFNCHVCKLEVAAVELDGRAALIHTTPMCERFGKLDPAEYMREAREVWHARQQIALAGMRAAERLKGGS